MPPPVPPPHHRSGGLSDESEGLHIASYASRPRLPQGQAFQPFSPGPALVAGGTAFTLALTPVTFSLCWRREEGGAGLRCRGPSQVLCLLTLP